MIRAYLEQRHEIRVADVDAAFAELDSEIGMSPAPAPAEASASAEAHDGRDGTGRRTQVLSAVAKRLDHLEKSVDGLVDLARSLTGPENRGRFGLRNRRG